jgi:hypothetical protein
MQPAGSSILYWQATCRGAFAAEQPATSKVFAVLIAAARFGTPGRRARPHHFRAERYECDHRVGLYARVSACADV